MHRWMIYGAVAFAAGCGPTGTGPTAVAPGAGGSTAADLTAQLEQVRSAEHLPALAMTVTRYGAIIARGVAGVRRAGDAAHPATIDDQWHLGSDTKAMTATLIGIYVDRGVLHWNDTLGKLFAGETIDPGYANVTLDQLLQHRGGAPHDASRDQLRRAGHAPGARSAFVLGLLAQPPAQPPGEFVYSNAGYIIAGAALERATHTPWEQLMREQLFAPLRMSSCGFGAPGDASLVDQPWGHTAQGSAIAPDDPFADEPPGWGPADTVHCSLADWSTFLSVHAARATPLLSTATLEHLHTAPDFAEREHYMGGWSISAVDGVVHYSHEGSNGHWQAIAVVIPALGETIAIAANQRDDGLRRAMQQVLRPYLRGVRRLGL